MNKYQENVVKLNQSFWLCKNKQIFRLELSEALQKLEVAACNFCLPWATNINVVAVGSWAKMAATQIWKIDTAHQLVTKSILSAWLFRIIWQKPTKLVEFVSLQILNQILSYDYGETCEYLYPTRNNGVAFGKRPIWHSQFIPSHLKSSKIYVTHPNHSARQQLIAPFSIGDAGPDISG